MSLDRLLARVRQVLSGSGHLSHAIHDTYRGHRAGGSQAASDLDSTYGVSIQTAYASAAVFLEASNEYLECLGRVFFELFPQKGVLFLCRGVVDNVARAWWLLSPESPYERARRGLLERFNHVQELIGVVSVSQDPEDQEAVTDQRAKLAAMVEDGRSKGFEVTVKRPYRVDGLARPTATALLTEIDGPEGALLYKVLSGSAHGASYATLMGMDVDGATEEWEGGLLVGPDDKLSPMDWAIAGAFELHCRAFDRYLCLMGWDREEWVKWRVHAMLTMRELLVAGGSAGPLGTPPISP